jgi:hypothetical protein
MAIANAARNQRDVQRFMSMALYFFNIRSDAGDDIDCDGLELPSSADAVREATKAAKEMVSEMVLQGTRIDGTRFEIADDAGAVIATVYLHDVILLD